MADAGLRASVFTRQVRGLALERQVLKIEPPAAAGHDTAVAEWSLRGTLSAPGQQEERHMDLTEATETARRVRGLYHQIEERVEGSPWSVKDDMIGLVNDVGTLSRLVMATEGRWAPEGDLPTLLEAKLAECLWWVLDLADRLEVDIAAAYGTTMEGIEARLERSVDLPDG